MLSLGLKRVVLETGGAIALFPEGSKLWLLSSLVLNRKGEHREVLAEARADGITGAE